MAKIKLHPSEADEQKTFVEWYKIYAKHNLPPLLSIPNERKAHPHYLKHLNEMGMWKGAPDLFIAWPRLGYHGLFIEMKSKVGKTSQAQLEAHKELRKWGYAVFVCKGADEAMAVVRAYTLDNGTELAAIEKAKALPS